MVNDPTFGGSVGSNALNQANGLSNNFWNQLGLSNPASGVNAQQMQGYQGTQFGSPIQTNMNGSQTFDTGFSGAHVVGPWQSSNPMGANYTTPQFANQMNPQQGSQGFQGPPGNAQPFQQQGGLQGLLSGLIGGNAANAPPSSGMVGGGPGSGFYQGFDATPLNLGGGSNIPGSGPSQSAPPTGMQNFLSTVGGSNPNTLGGGLMGRSSANPYQVSATGTSTNALAGNGIPAGGAVGPQTGAANPYQVSATGTYTTARGPNGTPAGGFMTRPVAAGGGAAAQANPFGGGSAGVQRLAPNNGVAASGPLGNSGLQQIGTQQALMQNGQPYTGATGTWNPGPDNPANLYSTFGINGNNNFGLAYPTVGRPTNPLAGPEWPTLHDGQMATMNNGAFQIYGKPPPGINVPWAQINNMTGPRNQPGTYGSVANGTAII